MKFQIPMGKSARGQAHSRTLRAVGRSRVVRILGQRSDWFRVF